jgi:hypothetical protein
MTKENPKFSYSRNRRYRQLSNRLFSGFTGMDIMHGQSIPGIKSPACIARIARRKVKRLNHAAWVVEQMKLKQAQQRIPRSTMELV